MKLYGLTHPINCLHNYLLIIFWLSETRQLVSDSVYGTALLKYQAFFIIPDWHNLLFYIHFMVFSWKKKEMISELLKSRVSKSCLKKMRVSSCSHLKNKFLCTQINTRGARKVKHPGLSLQKKEIFACLPPPGTLRKDVVYILVILSYLQGQASPKSPTILFICLRLFSLNLEYCFSVYK